MNVDDPTAGLRIREATRAIVLDERHRILLVRFEFPDGTRWALPGGGRETGETEHETLHRELAEEVGLFEATIGPHVWTRVHVIPFLDGSHDGQRDRYHLVRTLAFDPQPVMTWEQLNAEHLFEVRWWTLEQIAASDAHFVPGALATHLGALLEHGPPPAPIDVGV